MEDNIKDLILRYRVRLSRVFSHPNPYYSNPLYEKSEIEALVKRLEKDRLSVEK